MTILAAIFSAPPWLIGVLFVCLAGAVLTARWGLRILRRQPEPWEDDWQREPETEADAVQLIADLTTDLPGQPESMPAPLAGGIHLEPWLERGWWDDPDLVVWDARRQADRCWEILHVEFPRLRAELCGAAA